LSPAGPWARRLGSRLAPAAALAVLVLAVHGPTVGFAFVDYDDDDYVWANPRVLAGFGAGSAGWAFTTFHASNWHPLTWLSLMADAELFGPGPRGFHRTNLLLHAANAVLWWLVLWRLTGCRTRSAVVAALFAVHPLNVQVVAWVSERKELLATLFGLCSLIAWAAHSRRRLPAAYAISLASYACSLLSKPTWVTLPFLLVLLDAWPRGLRPTARLLAEKVPFLVLSAGASVAALWAQQAGGTVASVPVAARMGTALTSYAVYLKRAFWPAGLACFYPHPGAAPSWAAVAGALALLVLLTGGALLLARRHPGVGVGWCWFAGTLVPVIGLVQIGAQRTADRYVYLPLVGLFVALVWWIGAAARRGARTRRLLACGAAACIAALALASRAETLHWRDSASLWTRAVSVTQDNYLAHNHLGAILGAGGDLAGAIAHLDRAVALRPRYAAAHANLGRALFLDGRDEDAESHFRAALALEPRMLSAHVNWGLLLSRQGRWPEAVARLEAASEIAPGDAQVRDLLATARRRLESARGGP
jgi:tetratricopeptide (TPR) repeat protein